MKDFEYKVIDPEGHETLDAVATARQFNRWMYETILPHCQGTILEIGSGIGNISEFFLAAGHPICLSDIRPNYVDILTEKYGHYPNLRSVLLMDLVDPDFDRQFQPELETFDTIFALNVVEHIQDDELAVRNAGKLLKTGGKLIILVPAFQALYNRFDEELAHFRRYRMDTLDAVLQKSGLTVVHHQYFNFPGIFGWWLSGRILRKKTIPKGQMKLYDQLVPLFRIVDKVLLNQVGLSVISVGLKN